MEDKIKERFFKKVNKTETCWLWIGNHFSNGYGQFSIGADKYLAHRLSWIISGNTIPEGNVIRHKCRNRNCVNPDHLETGTHAENMADKFRDGTGTIGEKNPQAKLTVEQVVQIRARGTENQRKLAEEFDVSAMTINRIILRHIWKHI